MKGMLSKVIDHDFFPIVLSLFSLFIGSLIELSVSFLTVAIFSLVCGFQFLSGFYTKLDYYIASLEIKREFKTRAIRRWSRQVTLAASSLPLIASLSEKSALLMMLGYILISSLDFWPLIKKIINRKKIRAHAIEVIQSEKPVVAVYVTGVKGVAYQINQWLSVLEKIDQSVIIVLREADIFTDMIPTKLLVVTTRTQLDLEVIFNSRTSIKKILYPANTMKNVQALRYHHLEHYFINHGESDKTVNQSKLLMAYDYLLVAGPLSEDRLKAAGLPLRENQVVHVGRPQAEMLLTYETKIGEIKNILYAPTWEGHVKDVDYSSIGQLGYNLCESIIRSNQYKLIFKPHPYTGKFNGYHNKWLNKIIRLCRENNIDVCKEKDSIYDLMNDSDLLLCDISSVLNDYLITGKPILLCNPKALEYENLNINFPSSKAANLINNESDLLAIINIIEKQDPMRRAREEMRKYSMGDFGIKSMEKFRLELTV